MASTSCAEPRVRVAPSAIAGHGVFAAERLPRETRLGAYEGERLNEAQYWARYPQDNPIYVLRLRRGYVDAADPARSNFARFINSPKGTRKRANVYFRAPDGAVVTKRAIRAGEELLVDYGPTYSWGEPQT